MGWLWLEFEQRLDRLSVHVCRECGRRRLTNESPVQGAHSGCRQRTVFGSDAEQFQDRLGDRLEAERVHAMQHCFEQIQQVRGRVAASPSGRVELLQLLHCEFGANPRTRMTGRGGGGGGRVFRAGRAGRLEQLLHARADSLADARMLVSGQRQETVEHLGRTHLLPDADRLSAQHVEQTDDQVSEKKRQIGSRMFAQLRVENLRGETETAA